jgi:hypothetical protein
MRDMTKQDAERLHRGSRAMRTTPIGQGQGHPRRLTAWQTKFKKVMPVDYARALAEIAKHQSPDSTGLDVIEIGIRAAKASKNQSSRPVPGIQPSTRGDSQGSDTGTSPQRQQNGQDHRSMEFATTAAIARSRSAEALARVRRALPKEEVKKQPRAAWIAASLR